MDIQLKNKFYVRTTAWLCLACLIVLPTFAIAQELGALPENGFATPGPTASLPASANEGAMEARPLTEDAAPVVSPRRLLDILQSGGPLMIPIAICSFILVVFVFERFISLRKGRIIPGPFTKRFLEQLREGELTQDQALTICERNNSPMANVFKAGVMKWGRSAVEVEQAVLDEGERTSNRLRKYLRLINGVSTVCPLLGLLGTVLGMIHAFDSVVAVGASMAENKTLVIASGISQALLTTAAGLSVAIPAYIAYLFFSSRVDKHVMEIDSLSMRVVNLVSAEAMEVKTTKTRTKKAA